MVFAEVSPGKKSQVALTWLGLWLASAAAGETLPRAPAEAAFIQAVRTAQATSKALAAAEVGGDASQSETAHRVAEARGLYEVAQADLAHARTVLAEALAAEYATRHLRLATRPGDRWQQGEFRLCADLTNLGPLTVTAITVDVQLRGVRVASRVAVRDMLVAEDETADILTPTGSRAGVAVLDGLPSKQTWRQTQTTCLRLNEATLSAGVAAEALRPLGGFSRDRRDWRLTIGAVVLAQPVFNDNAARSASQGVTGDHAAVFKEHILRTEQTALGLGSRAPSSGVPGSSSAVLRLQAALNARGFPVGAPDGVMGPRTVAAITALQQAEGLTLTGTLTEDQLERLMGTAE